MLGKLITLEGGEGSGKTTQIEYIQKYLVSGGIPTLVTREPGGVIISEEIRNIILNKENTSMDKITELLLFMASRRQVIKELIEPALLTGTWIICDRYIDSSVVYQGIVRGIDTNLINNLNNIVTDLCIPNLTLFLDIDPCLGLERAGKRGELTRIDVENIQFHEKVRNGYTFLWSKYPDRIKRINAKQSEVLVFNEIQKYLDILLDY